MVFSGDLFQFVVINAHTPPSDSPSRDELMALILNNSHTTVFGDYLNQKHPFGIRDRIDDPGVK